MKWIITGVIAIIFVIIFIFVGTGKNAAKKERSTNTKDGIGEELNSKGLNRIADGILSNIRYSIRLHTYKINEDDIAIGETKIGGRPDLPKDFIWPVWKSKHLSFIAQLNLAEISEYDQEKILPDSGILYFFYESNQETWGFDPKDLGSWKVIYYDGNKKSLSRFVFPGDIPEEARYAACKVKIENELSLPDWDSLYIEELRLTKKENDKYIEIYEEQADDSIINKMLGHPDQIQNEMQLECQLVSNGLYCGDSSGYKDPRKKILEKSAKDWRLLLQIDSDENSGMMWGDAGRLYFWIRGEDLKDKKFDKTWMIFQCG